MRFDLHSNEFTTNWALFELLLGEWSSQNQVLNLADDEFRTSQSRSTISQRSCEHRGNNEISSKVRPKIQARLIEARTFQRFEIELE